MICMIDDDFPPESGEIIVTHDNQINHSSEAGRDAGCARDPSLTYSSPVQLRSQASRSSGLLATTGVNLTPG